MTAIYKSFVIHNRRTPKVYKFGYNFFWYYFDLNDLEEMNRDYILFSYNGFNLFSFNDRDHFKIQGQSLKDSIKSFCLEHGVSDKIESIKALANLKFLGHVFNPVSYFYITTAKKETHCIIEICNTYKEIKPYFVHNKYFKNNKFDFTTQKDFYISPYCALDNTMNFKIGIPDKSLFINIFDYKKDGQLEISTHLKANKLKFSDRRLLINAFSKPFATIQIVFAIHWHALKLFLLKVPYFKKDENKHLQRGYQLWK